MWNSRETLPVLEPDPLHEALKRYGEARIAAPGAEVEAVRAIETAAAVVKPDPANEFAEWWARIAQHELAQSAASRLADRLPAKPKPGRHIAQRVLAESVERAALEPPAGSDPQDDTSGFWRERADEAWRALFNYDGLDRWDTMGIVVRNVLGIVTMAGRGGMHAGLQRSERERILRRVGQWDKNKNKKAERQAALVSEIVEIGTRKLRELWGDRAPADILEMALEGKLDVAGVRVSQAIIREFEKADKREPVVGATQLEDEILHAEGDVADRFDAATTEILEAQRRKYPGHLEALEDLSVLLGRKPTVKELAAKIGRPERTVERESRAIRQARGSLKRQRSPRPTAPASPKPRMRIPGAWGRQDIRDHFDTVVARQRGPK